jgi:uncharacterized protein (TIGR03437 family)
MYAAVSGSALAMTTGTSASIITGPVRFTPQPAGSIRVAKSHQAAFTGLQSVADARFAIAIRYAGQDFLHRVQRPRLLALDPASSPSIAANGVVPFFGATNIIQPGEWVSIYGQNLAASTANWNFDFPTSLAGTRVLINGKAAYLSYVSPTQINLQAPDDTARGPVSVVVITAAGTATSTVTLSEFAPSFILLKDSYVSGMILRSNGSGAFGGGTYDILGPTGDSFGYPTVSARQGDIVELFGVGFGPTTPTVPAGAVFNGTAPVNTPVSLYINNVLIQPTFVGLSSAGLYEIKLVVPPGLGEGAVPIQLSVGGMQTQMGVLFSLYCPPPVVTGTGGTVGGTMGGGTGGLVGGGSGGGTMGGGMGGGGTMGGGMGGGTMGGGGGGGMGGTGGGAGGSGGGTGGGGGSGGGTGGGTGGGSAAIRRKPYQPTLQFGPAAETKVKDA